MSHDTSADLNHRLVPMTGRDPHERGRVASPLELLFDLTFAVSFSTAAANFAHLVSIGHIATALVGFGFCCFAIVWAWINFSWFASAYDTDDWLYRLVTMVQMVGVVVMALGMPAMFHSLEEGHHFDNRVMVAGYVLMRLAMLAQWARPYRNDPGRRNTIRQYIVTLGVAQVGWIVLCLLPLTIWQTMAAAAVLVAIEVSGPVIAEFKHDGTPWHAHHMVERYSLLAIITLGEGVVGTVATLADVTSEGWTAQAVMVVIAGIGLTFAMWWVYFAATMPDVLHHHRERSFGFGYVHLLTFSAIAATGAGLHVAGYVMEGEATISTAWAVAATAIPVAIYIVSIFILWNNMARQWDTLHTVLISLTLAVLALAVWLGHAGVGLGECLLVVLAGAAVTVVGYETFGHHHMAEVLEREGVR